MNTRPGIAIESPCGGACDEDIPDEVGRYFVAHGDRTNRAQLAGELFDPAGIVFGDKEISGPGESIAIKRALGIAHDENVPLVICRDRSAHRDRTNRAQLAGELLDPAGIVFGDEEISGPGESIIVKRALGIACDENIPAGIGGHPVPSCFFARHP